MNLAIQSMNTGENLECWIFKIIPRQGIKRGISDKLHLTRKQMKVVKMEIGDVPRQISAIVAVMPRLPEKTYYKTFVDHDGTLQSSIWDKSYECLYIPNAKKIELNSFETGWHEIKTSVEYKPPPSLTHKPLLF